MKQVITYLCIAFLVIIVTNSCSGRRLSDATEGRGDASSGPGPIHEHSHGTGVETTDNGLVAGKAIRDQGLDSSIEDGRVMEDGDEESIAVNKVVSALDLLEKSGSMDAKVLLERQNREQESLFPTVLMETTIMRSDPPNFYKYLLEDYLNALVKYMLPSTLP